MSAKHPPKIRTFETGATRDADDGKLDYEAFLSPIAIKAFAEYMHRHRIQPDGKLRPGDNWQLGIDIEAYMKSQWRHHVDAWLLHRGHKVTDPKTGEPVTMKEALCAVIFNAMGHLHELLKEEQIVPVVPQKSDDTPMNINANPGALVVFQFPNNGNERQQQICAKHLKVGQTYTIDRVDDGTYHNYVHHHNYIYLREVPDVAFNTVMFIEAWKTL